jgi:hypothetical protein
MNEFDHLLEELLQKTAGLELSRVVKLWVAYRKQLGQKNPCPQRAYEEAWTSASVETKVRLLKRELPSGFKRSLELSMMTYEQWEAERD